MLATHITSLNDGLEKQWAGKKLAMGRVLDNVPGQPISLEKEVVNGLASWLGAWKEGDGSTKGKELSSRGMWMDKWE